MAKVSIGMPVYNGESFLRKALESLLNQDFRDFELIISDNASTDKTQEISLEYAKKDSRIRYHRHPVNFVAVKNFNWVFRETSSEYFMWAAYDDLWAPAFLGRCVEWLEANREAVLCTTYVNFIDENDEEYPVLDRGFETIGLDLRHRLQSLYRYSAACTAMYGLFRADALKKTSLFRETWYPDFCLLFELSILGPFIRVPEKLFFYREFRKKREKGLLMTMRSICNANTRAPRYPLTGIYLMTQAWKELYKIVFRIKVNFGTKCLIALDTTVMFFRLWQTGIFRDHRVKLYACHERGDRFGVIVAGIFCVLFNPLMLFDRDFLATVFEAVAGKKIRSALRGLRK